MFIELLMQALTIALSDAEALSGTTSTVSELSEGVSRKIRQLDQMTCRVRDCLDQTEHLLLKDRAAQGAKEAFERLDFEAAAKHVEHFLEFQQEQTGSSFKHVEQEQVRLQTAHLLDCRFWEVIYSGMQFFDMNLP